MKQDDEVRELVEMAAAGKFNLSSLLTTRIQLNEINEGLEMMETLNPLGVVMIN